MLRLERLLEKQEYDVRVAANVSLCLTKYDLNTSAPQHHVAMCRDYFGKKAIIEFVQGPKGDVDKTYACLTHSFNDLGFKPKTSLKEGMRSFLDWYIQYHKLQVPSS